MKRIVKITALALLLMLFNAKQNTISAQFRAGINVSYQTFYDELSPYGRWISYPEYGYVWLPNEGPDFRPYSSNGYWVWTDDYEWMWVSDYDWGWAPFHYGRWFYDSWYGWIWMPGYEWSPAWVAWRQGGDYYGWAPLRPGISININFSLGRYSPPNDYWNFTPRRFLTSRNLHNYCVDRIQNITIINQTTVINNYNYNRNVFRTGPRRNEVERYTGNISPARFRESSRPGRSEFRNNEVAIYKPNVQKDNDRRFAPKQFDRYNGQRETIDRKKPDNNRQLGPDERKNQSNEQPVDRQDRKRFERNDGGFINPNERINNNDRGSKQDDHFRNDRIARNNNRDDSWRIDPKEKRDQTTRENDNGYRQNNDRRKMEKNDFPVRNSDPERNVKPEFRNNNSRDRSFLSPSQKQQDRPRQFEKKYEGNPNPAKNDNNDRKDRGGKRKG